MRAIRLSPVLPRLFAVPALAALFAIGCQPEGFYPKNDVKRPPAGDCSADVPDGVCPDGQTCRAGACLDDALFCSADVPTGVCASTDETCLDGACVPTADLCSDQNPDGQCATDLACHGGVCATDAPCAADEPLGFCDTGLACLDGTCVDRATLCSATNTSGDCRQDTACVDGTCVDGALLCSPANANGLCAQGESCVGGGCRTPDELCSNDNPTGACDAGLACVDGACVDASQACGCTATQTCIDGICRDPAQLCSTDNPTGVCENGASCVAGNCEDLGAACSPQNLTGVCPPGELCESGACNALDGTALCDDNNECTDDAFDPVRNRCVNTPRDGSCDDGNACTTNQCVDGQCTGTPVSGCIEPPVIDPVVSPTNVGELALSGTKPAGASVQVNGLEAVPENPDTTWSVTVNLTPGDNAFQIKSINGATESAVRELHVVYDITPPVTRVTPDGGSFLSGVTATLAASEPATVFFTTDGSDPDDTSASFSSEKRLRVFSDTHLRLRARDLAGNLEEQIVDVAFSVTGRGTAWQDGPTLAAGLSLAGATTTGPDVFIAGGTSGLAPQAGAYSYSIADDTFTTLPSMSGARDSLALVAVGNDVYAIGGENAGTPLNRVELLADGASSWVQRAAMPSTRHSLAAVAVGTKIYVFGGKTNGGAVLDNVEVYDIAGDSWSNAVAQMPRPRAGFGAVVIDGLVYLVGGEAADGSRVTDLDVYNPDNDSWSTRAPLPTGRSYLGVTAALNRGAITSGERAISAAGGLLVGDAPTAVVEEYIIDEDVWRPRAPLPAPRHSAASVTVVTSGGLDSEEGEGWLIGGQEGSNVVATTRALRTDLDYARALPDLPAARFLHVAAALDDRIYLFGGRNFTEETGAYAFDPETGTYEELPPLPSVQNGPGGVAVGGRVYAFGGANEFANAVPTTRAYDPALHQWVELSPMTSARRDVAVTAVGNDVYVIGGENGGALQTVEIYDVATDQWRTGPLLPAPRKGAMAVTHGGKVHVIGGEGSDGSPVATVLRLDDQTWTTLSGSIPVSYGAAFSIQGRIAVFAGRVSGAVSSSVIDYDVAEEQVLTPRNPTELLTPALDRFAATSLNGRLFFFGGNANADIGPSGVVTVVELDGRCFDGVLDGTETAGGANGADDGGGCPDAGFLHHTGFPGETFVSETQGSITSVQSAIDACNAHFGSGSCALDTSCDNTNGCFTVVPSSRHCTCASGPAWHIGTTTCYGGSNIDVAGRVSNFSGTCNGGSLVGNWD